MFVKWFNVDFTAPTSKRAIFTIEEWCKWYCSCKIVNWHTLTIKYQYFTNLLTCTKHMILFSRDTFIYIHVYWDFWSLIINGSVECNTSAQNWRANWRKNMEIPPRPRVHKTLTHTNTHIHTHTHNWRCLRSAAMCDITSLIFKFYPILYCVRFRNSKMNVN